jgi:hypothetical protein
MRFEVTLFCAAIAVCTAGLDISSSASEDAKAARGARRAAPATLAKMDLISILFCLLFFGVVDVVAAGIGAA